MSVQRVASRYAKSLIDLAVEQNKLDRVLEDIEGFNKALESRDFYLLLKSPIINQGKKASIFKAIFGDQFDEMTNGFFKIILNKGRESYLPEIADEYIAQYRAIKNISTVKLTTAVPLDDAAVEKIKAKLKASSELEANIEINTSVNPDIIGGFVLEFDNKLYDASVAQKLEELKKEFSKNDFIRSL